MAKSSQPTAREAFVPLKNSDVWHCNRCAAENLTTGGNKCKDCGYQQTSVSIDIDFLDPKVRIWSCPKCNWFNPHDTEACNKCASEKTAHAKERPILTNTLSLLEHMRDSITIRDRNDNDARQAEIIHRNIVDNCAQLKVNYIDKEFCPSIEAVGQHHMHLVHEWIRIRDVVPMSKEDRNLPLSIYSEPKPTDIEQGALGNCWLVAVIALICEKPSLLDHIVLTKTVNSAGVYLIRICHNGVWKIMILDDYFPATKYKSLVFTKAKRRQFYIPLIEKACAKLFGSYESLRSGTIIEGLQLMTGAPCDYIDLQPQSFPLDADLVWAKLLSAIESNLLIGASTSGTKASGEEYNRVRINMNHAFSILAAHSSKKVGDRYILVRDPHSIAYYKENTMTDEKLSILKSINPTNRSDGAFWIVWSTFLRFFSSITISTYSTDNFDARDISSFTENSSSSLTSFSFTLKSTSMINISLLYHRETRKAKNHHVQSFILCDKQRIDSGPVQYGEKVQIFVSRRGGYSRWNGLLEPGDYIVIPFSMSFWHKSQKQKEYTFVIHSSVSTKLESKKVTPDFLGICLGAYLIKAARKRSQKGDSVLYQESSQSGMTILMAENLSSSKFLKFDVELNCEKSVMHHSRGSMKTSDCIPPRFRQILGIFEWNYDEHCEQKASWTFWTNFTKDSSSSVPALEKNGRDLHQPQPF